ncbi:MAG: hypothetical protein U5K71_04680 [Gracilimonas sp.]|nr:hypothetical protein [Gracilimonas sp.]
MGYTTWQNSGNSYDVTSLVKFLIQAAKSDTDWYRDFRVAYENGFPVFGVPPGNVIEARKFADSGNTLLTGREANPRYEPGTPEFQQKVNQIINSTDPVKGAAIRDNSLLYHLQSNYELPEVLTNTDFSIGANFRYYDIF